MSTSQKSSIFSIPLFTLTSMKKKETEEHFFLSTCSNIPLCFVFFFNLIKPCQSSVPPQTVLTPLELQSKLHFNHYIMPQWHGAWYRKPFFSSRTAPNHTLCPARLFTCIETQNASRSSSSAPLLSLVTHPALTQNQHSEQRLLHWYFMQSKIIHRLLSFAAAAFHRWPSTSILLV